MSRAGEELPVVYLKAGEMHYAERPSLVVTVLGSCLSVTMHCRRLGIGGICHGLLPSCEDRRACSKGCSTGFKYVDCSLRQMIELFDRAGARRRDVEVK
jgi:chemotaxis protein CheD